MKGGAEISLFEKAVGVDIGKILDRVQKNPTDTAVKNAKSEIINSLRAYIVECQRRFLVKVLLKLFDGDCSSCQRGITKCIVLKPKDISLTEKERDRALAVIWEDVVLFNCGKDFSPILNDIALMALDDKCSKDTDIPI